MGKANKLTYQMDPGNSDEAIREIQMDIDEGADMIMMKPALPYLDIPTIDFCGVYIIRRAYQKFNLPIFAYHPTIVGYTPQLWGIPHNCGVTVSGEYTMIRAAADNGSLSFEEAIIESLVSMRRAGANSVLTYAAMEVYFNNCHNC